MWALRFTLAGACPVYVSGHVICVSMGISANGQRSFQFAALKWKRSGMGCSLREKGSDLNIWVWEWRHRNWSDWAVCTHPHWSAPVCVNKDKRTIPQRTSRAVSGTRTYIKSTWKRIHARSTCPTGDTEWIQEKPGSISFIWSVCIIGPIQIHQSEHNNSFTRLTCPLRSGCDSEKTLRESPILFMHVHLHIMCMMCINVYGALRKSLTCPPLYNCKKGALSMWNLALKKLVSGKKSLPSIANKWAAPYRKWNMTGDYGAVKWFTCSNAHVLCCWRGGSVDQASQLHVTSEAGRRGRGLNLAVFKRQATPVRIPLRSIFHRGTIIKTWVSECQALGE